MFCNISGHSGWGFGWGWGHPGYGFGGYGGFGGFHGGHHSSTIVNNEYNIHNETTNNDNDVTNNETTNNEIQQDQPGVEDQQEWDPGYQENGEQLQDYDDPGYAADDGGGYDDAGAEEFGNWDGDYGGGDFDGGDFGGDFGGGDFGGDFGGGFDF